MTGDEVNVASRHQILLPISVEYTEEPEEHVDNQSTTSESMAEDDHLCTAAVIIVVDDPVSHVTTVEPPPLIQVSRHSDTFCSVGKFLMFLAFWLIGLLIRSMCGVWCELDEGGDPFGRIVLSLVHGWRSTLLRLCPFFFFFFQLNGTISKLLLVRLLTPIVSFCSFWSLLFITRPGRSSFLLDLFL